MLLHAFSIIKHMTDVPAWRGKGFPLYIVESETKRTE